MPLLARAPYGVVAATAVSMLPWWARLPLRLPYVPPVETTAIRAARRSPRIGPVADSLTCR